MANQMRLICFRKGRNCLDSSINVLSSQFSIQFIEEMNDNLKYSDFEDKLPDTADDFYPSAKAQELTKTAISSLLVTLNSKKTELKSLLIQRNSICQRMNEIDVKVGKLTITNQFLSSESDNLRIKNAELLTHKKDLQSQLKDWKQAVACLKLEASKTEQEFRQRKGYIAQLMKREQQLRQKIKQKQFQCANVQDYNVDLDCQTQQLESQLGKKKDQRDELTKMATTLQTFSKAFKKNIIQKEKEVSRMKFESGQLEGFIATKSFEKGNLDKQIEKSEWECKMYVHHNSEIEKTNEKLKIDLEKLMKHLQSLKKSNKHLSSCIRQYSETGVSAAKKILMQSNK